MNFGNIPDPIDSRDYPFVRHESTLQIPMQFDLSAYFDEPFNQTDGADTECATCCVGEYWTRRRGMNFDRLDPQYILSNTVNKSIRECLKIALNGILPVSKKGDPQAQYIAQKYSIAQYERIPDLNGILESISQWQPVIVSMKYFPSFDPTKQDIPLPNNETATGNMACVIIGFDQYTRKLTIMHSLGTSSGVNGHFYLTFDYEPYINDAWSVKG